MAEQIVSVIVEKLEAIQADPDNHDRWEMPWHTIHFVPTNAKTGKPYSGSNFVYFGLLPDIKNRESDVEWNNWWATFRQWETLGRKIRKNEEATYGKRVGVFFPKPNTEDADSEADDLEDKPITPKRFVSPFAVFNYAQTEPIEGAKKVWEPPEVGEIERLSNEERIPEIEKWVEKTLAEAKISLMQTSSGRAYYNEPNIIVMPPFEHFDSPENYYSTLFHEMTHATACAPKPNAPGGRIIRKSHTEYQKNKKMRALEELTAELGSVFLSHAAGIAPQPHSARTVDLSVKYIADWIEYIKHDKDAITKATAQARESIGVLNEFAGTAKLGEGNLLEEFISKPQARNLTKGPDPRKSIRETDILPMYEYIEEIEWHVMQYYGHDEYIKERFDETVPAWLERLEQIKESGDMHVPHGKKLWIQENLENCPPTIWYNPRGNRGNIYRMPEDIGFPYTAEDFSIPEWGDEEGDDSIWHFGNQVFAGLMKALGVETKVEYPV